MTSNTTGLVVAYVNYIVPCLPKLNATHCGLTISGNNISSVSRYNFLEVYSCCSTDNCNNQAGYCISSQYVTDAANANSSINTTNLVISKSCDSGSIPPSFVPTVKIVITLKLNLVYIYDYTNLSSIASLAIIAQYKSFVWLQTIQLNLKYYSRTQRSTKK